MSKLYKMYLKLKIENSEIIYLFKSGIFYIALDNDALILSEKYNLKLTNLNSNIVKCGFPCNNFDKYYSLFLQDNINFKLVDDDTIFSFSDYKKYKNIDNILEKISNVNIDDLSVSEAYNL